MFDLIAYRNYGDCMYTQELMRANRDKLEKFRFKANEEVELPEIKKTAEINLPPWKLE